MIVGITGTIASGKSTVTQYFTEKKYRVLDADQVTREVQASREVLEELTKVFGQKILQEDGSLDRKFLREQVFQNQELLPQLNAIIHPRVRLVFEKAKQEQQSEGILFFDVPLLFEAKFENLCDKVLLVCAKREIQIQRVMQRDGSSRELAEKIISAQASEEEKRKRADYIVENNTSLADLYCRLEEVEEKIHEDCCSGRE